MARSKSIELSLIQKLAPIIEIGKGETGPEFLLNPIRRRTLSESAVDQVKRYIISGKIKPGAKLPAERELCQLWGVGRSSVREALQMLQAVGWIKVLPGKGTFVRDVSEPPTDMSASLVGHRYPAAEILAARAVLERAAIQLAVQQAVETDWCKIDAALNAIHEAIRAGSPSQLVFADLAFHGAILDATGNQLLKRIGSMLDDLLVQTRTIRVNSRALTLNHNQALAAHVKILQVLRSRSARAARQAAENHDRHWLWTCE